MKEIQNLSLKQLFNRILVIKHYFLSLYGILQPIPLCSFSDAVGLIGFSHKTCSSPHPHLET